MSQDILVVEYEPRYTDRVRQALSGQPFVPFFAKDGEEALQALDSSRPRLIVLSAMLPRISTVELIRVIRGRDVFKKTPILVTVSGYNGKSTKADAVRFGADDLLPKPYSETEFLTKIQQLLSPAATQQVSANAWMGGLPPDVVANPAQVPEAMTADVSDKPQLTSSEIFGELLEEEKPAEAPRKPHRTHSGSDVDKILADTLSGVRVATAKKTHAPTEEQKTKSKADLDQLLNDTLSGVRKSTADSIPIPKVSSGVHAPSSAAVPDRIHMASPVLVPKPAPEEDVFDVTGGARFGQYLLEEKIATGGMAEVWKARMKGVEGFQKVVAIKKILPHISDNEEFVTMFVDEAKLAAQLNHNNIIHIYDLGKVENSYYIAMEYIDGADLKTILKRGVDRGQPLAIELALFVTSKIASALDYAHRKRDFHEKELGLVHRDVSPQNVLISHEGDIKLCDFGIAKAASKASHTQAGALKGKLQYMSPEQAWGRSIDRRSDIFALATVLFEMLCGRKLFTGDNEISILEQVREAKFSAPSRYNDEVTPEIDAIVIKALQKEPEARYQTAGEMAKDLDAVLYSFRPTPTSADLAIHMHRLHSEEELVPAPRMMEEPVNEIDADEIAIAPMPVLPTPLPPVSHTPHPHGGSPASHAHAGTDSHLRAHPVHSAKHEPPKKKFPVAAVIAGVVVLGGAAAAVVMLWGGKADAAPRGSVAQAAQPAAPLVAAPTDSALLTAPTVTDSTATTATLDPARAAANEQTLIDEEVRRLVAAERQRLEQQRAQQVAANRPQTSAPAPIQNDEPAAVTQPASPPPVQQPTATVAETANETPPVSQPAASATRTVREGDLVEVGTAGLIAAELVSLRKPAYPPMAKLRKISGVVVLSVLVSEAGRVLDVRLLRGVSQDVGINEAAQDAARTATFRPATKDGVRVKAWKTITIPFQL